ncbi:MAG: protein meaA [Deltaproteobacteria bacterium]|nr:MAG: protein meaA [Deltaproteobacteria bacterium]
MARDPWIIRTYAGFGDAEQTNARFRDNLSRGQKGLSVAFDLPTQNGYDSDDPLAAGEVGGTGVAVGHLGDMERLFEGIDIGSINTSMTINATAPWLLALYVALADRRGVSRDRLRGTTQNDILKEFVGRGTHIFAPEPSLRLQTEVLSFASREIPNWNGMNACGYHYMESGCTPAEEVGFAIGNAVLVLDRLRETLDPEQFATVVHRLSFFINSGIELVPEIAKVRAYAKLWPEICFEEYGVEDVRWRAGCQVRSLTLTEQQPEVNIVRIAYEALPVTLSASARVRALQLPGFREALSLPDQGEQTLALRTQQVLMHETGIAKWGDIFEGSHVVEGETSRVMQEARGIVQRMRELGFEQSMRWISERLTAGLVEAQGRLTSGEEIRVGVNAFVDPVGVARPSAVSEEGGGREEAVARQLEGLRRWRADRDAVAVSEAREALLRAARSDGGIMAASIALAEAGGTTGEWTKTLEDAFGGRFQAPLGSDVQGARSLDVPKAPRRIRFFLAKSGLDGHVNAVKLLAYACRESGMEVIYSGLQQTPAAIAAAAIQEDADVIGISSLSGAHLHLAAEVQRELASRGAQDIPVLMGGIIPAGDEAALRALGIAAIFTPKDGDVGAIVQRIIDVAESGRSTSSG